MGSQPTNAAVVAGEDAVLTGLRRGLGRDGILIPAHQTLDVDVPEATAGSAVVRVPRSPHLTTSDGGLLPGAFAVLADLCPGGLARRPGRGRPDGDVGGERGELRAGPRG